MESILCWLWAIIPKAWKLFESNYQPIIAIAALYVAWNSQRTSKASLDANMHHQRLSCRPHLSSWFRTHEDTKKNVLIYTFELKNNGLGPARIKSFQVFVSGLKVVDNSSLEKALLWVLSGTNGVILSTTHLMQEECIAAGESIELFRVEAPKSEQDINWEGLFMNARVIIEYESFYEEKMPELDTDKFKPKPIPGTDQACNSHEEKADSPD